MDANLEARVAEERRIREHSVLGMLFDASRQEDALEDPEMAKNYEGLYQSMEDISFQQQEQILQWVALIHTGAEREGVDRGVKLGHRLKEEMG